MRSIPAHVILKAVPSPSSTDHAARYRGKNLLVLLLALAAPASLLYLRLVFAYVAAEGQLPRTRLPWLTLSSNAALLLFIPVQWLSARYVQRLLTPRATLAGTALQFLAVLLLCVLLSLTGAVLLEGFGYNFLLRTQYAHHRL